MTASLKEILAKNINHPWLAGLQSPWPVSLEYGENRKIGAEDWQLQSIEEDKAANETPSFKVTLADPVTNIEAELEIKLYPQWNAVRLGGQFHNNGTGIIKQCAYPKILDAKWQQSVAPEPFIRRIHGGPWGDVAYPPYGLAVSDVQLPHHYQHWTAVRANCSVRDGRASSQYQPLMVIGDDKEGGILIALEWAGSYSIECARDQDFWGHNLEGDLVTTSGVEGVNITLYPGMALPLPNLWLQFYQGDLDAGCQSWRSFFGDRLAAHLSGEPVTPFICFNHWIGYEITGFSESLAVKEAAKLAEAGGEYFVFDAGWTTGSDPYFRAGNGNWETPDPVKIPSGFARMGQEITRQGVKFGSWLEPESADANSQLVQRHPDWFLHFGSDTYKYPDVRKPVYYNLLMNFGLREVQDWWVNFISNWYLEGAVRWIRWDFNQNPGPIWLANDTPETQGLTQIYHIRGLYATLDRIREACPELVIEQCSSGGHRLEPGLLRRAHTYWINDHSSSPALIRHFQHGMNLFWPAQYANMNVVSRDGNISEQDWLSHQAGSFGISSRLSEWQPEKLQELARQFRRYKSFRKQLKGVFHSQTGQPGRLRGLHRLDFGSGKNALSLEHNLDTGQSSVSSGGEVLT